MWFLVRKEKLVIPSLRLDTIFFFKFMLGIVYILDESGFVSAKIILYI